MSWAERRAKLLGKAPTSGPAIVEHPLFEPTLPHLVTNGYGGWVLTPYAWAHCVFCGTELPEDQAGECPPCRAKIDATVMPWERGES